MAEVRRSKSRSVAYALAICLLETLGALNFAQSTAEPIRFELSDGDKITCLPFLEQPSLADDHCTGFSHQLFPATIIIPGNSTYSTRGAKRAHQLLTLEVGGCPDATIPVREQRGFWFNSSIIAGTRGDKGHFNKFRKSLHGHAVHMPKGFNFTTNSSLTPHEYGVVESVRSNTTSFKGMEATFNLWDPYVEGLGEFSLGQMWLISGSYEENNLNTIEVGFQVSKGAYGDNLPRLFIYWTRDAYESTGCYNLECPGFVQVSNKVLIGGTFSPISVYKGAQYEFKLRIFKDDASKNWWLQLNEENVGFWPRKLFTELRDIADYLDWGGEIVDDQPHDGNRHTRTQMGSGHSAFGGLGRAAYIRNMQFIDKNNSLNDAHVKPLMTDPNCYGVQEGWKFRDWGSYFWYGGVGYSKKCRSNKNIPIP